jgi:predicted negative regulator of RcsB-dependent stress response
MKRKEKERLKSDPFVHFMQQALAWIKGHRRPLLIGAGAAALAAVALLAVLVFQNLSASGENRLYADVFRIQGDGKMSLAAKIAALEKLTLRRGISASGHLFLAALHYEKGDLAKAEAVLAAMPPSRVPLLNDEKSVLLARVLAAGGKGAEARAVLERLLAAKRLAMARELVLLQLAKLQGAEQRRDEAIATLKRIVAEYGETPSAVEARTLLAAGEPGATGDR